MARRTIHPLLAAAVAYPFATWLLAACLLVRSLASGQNLDGSMWILLVGAPVAVPLLMLYGIGNWMGGYRQKNEIPWWCVGLAVAWLLCFAVVRFITTTRRAK